MATETPDTDIAATPGAAAPEEQRLHDLADERLRRSGQRYTGNRRALVAALADAPKPVTVAELLSTRLGCAEPAYRNLAILERADVVERVVTPDDFTRHELAHDLMGHHHHMVCTGCGTVIDFELPEDF
ncbi:MAG: transcriptional repressor [Microthrixaceae bacterium]